MQRLSKIVSWTSIVLLFIWILTPIFGTFIPLEFSNNHYEYIYDSIRFFGIPIAIFLILVGTIKRIDTSGIIATKIFTAMIISAFAVFIMFMTVFAGMCDDTTDKVFFENKQRPSTKIVQRSFGCGATDSSPATMKVSQIREITPYLIWVTSVDTNQIDKSEWNRIK
jgi:hypothetical protein